MIDKTFGKSGSVYNISFAKKGNPQTSSAKNRAECNWQTGDLNATHFQFGTDPNGYCICSWFDTCVVQSARYGTETTHSFKPVCGPGTGENVRKSPSAIAAETYKPCVFRDGDWNVAEPEFVRHSVTCNDFHIKPFERGLDGTVKNLEKEGEDHSKDKLELTDGSKDDPNHRHYQRSTHFVLGSSPEDRWSIYYKDFMLGKKEYLNKPLPAPPPMSSKVLPSAEDSLPLCSTNTTDFVDYKNRIKQIGQERAAITRFNKERHNTQAVMLTCDPRRHTGDWQTSMTGDDYLHPPKGFGYLSPRQAPRSKYRYLDSDGVLLKAPQWPLTSETKGEFVPIEASVKDLVKSQLLKEKQADCVARIKENKTSHFQFGSDDEPRHSEQHDQFSKVAPVDPSLPAAGKSEGPEQRYSHVYPSESVEETMQSTARYPAPHDKVGMIQDHVQQLSQQRFSNPRDSMNINLRKAFLEFDTSLSGKISKDDLGKVLNNLNIEMDGETFEELFNKCDDNHSGFIDYQEFAKHLSKDPPLSRGLKPPEISVMRADYAPPDQRRLTSAQLRAIEMSKRIARTSVTSHYFHKHYTGAPRFSTTAQDFVRPDRLPGTPRVSAQLL